MPLLSETAGQATSMSRSGGLELQTDRGCQTRARLLQKLCAKKWTNHVIFAVISDPDDPKFDLEAYLTLSEAK